MRHPDNGKYPRPCVCGDAGADIGRHQPSIGRDGRVRRTASGGTGTENTRVPAQVQNGGNFGVYFKAAFVPAYNQLVTEKKEIIANAEIIRKTLCVTDALQEEKDKLEEDMAVLVEMTRTIVAENVRVAQNQGEYQKRYDGLVQRYDTAKARYGEVVSVISEKEAQSERLAHFIKVLKTQDYAISEFDGSLWGSMVKFVTVGRDKEITVTFRDGTEIQV